MCKRGFLIYRYCLRLLEFIICIYPYLLIYKYVRSLWCLEGLFSSIFFVSSEIYNPSNLWSLFYLCSFVVKNKKLRGEFGLAYDVSLYS